MTEPMTFAEALAYLKPNPANNGTISLKAPKAREAVEAIEAAIAALRSKDREREDGVQPDYPSPGLLMSMAIRYDHALGMAGARDWKVMPGLGEREPGRHARVLANTMTTMHQLWEEATGAGFYNPEREAAYVASAKACGVGFDENGRPVALPLSPARTEGGNA